MSDKHSSYSRRAVWIACSAAALSVFTGNVHAAAQPQQKIVRYAEFELASPQHASELYMRLERAAVAVCRTFAGLDVSRQKTRLACEEEALSNAVDAIDSAVLRAVHNADSRTRFAQRRAGAVSRS